MDFHIGPMKEAESLGLLSGQCVIMAPAQLSANYIPARIPDCVIRVRAFVTAQRHTGWRHGPAHHGAIYLINPADDHNRPARVFDGYHPAKPLRTARPREPLH